MGDDDENTRFQKHINEIIMFEIAQIKNFCKIKKKSFFVTKMKKNICKITLTGKKMK